MQLTYTLEADFDKDGTYETDLSADVGLPGSGVTIDRGMGNDGLYRISKTTIVLKNESGKYSYGNIASVLNGKLRPDVPIRLVATHNSIDYTYWSGYIFKYENTAQVVGKIPTVTLSCSDIAAYLADSDLINVASSASRDTDGALTAIADAVGLVSGDLSFADGVQDLPLHYALGQKALAAMMDVVRSEMGGSFWVNADNQLVFEARNTRLGISADQTWGDGTNIQPRSAKVIIDSEDYTTAIRARATVFRTGQADIEIFRFSRSGNTGDSIAIAAGATYERDFDTQSAVVSITAPVSGTDYSGNSAIDGSATDKTSALTVTVTDRGAGRFNLKIKNTDGSTVYVTFFRLRGQPVNFYADRPEAYFSKSIVGRKAGKEISIDVPFAGDSTKFRDYAYALLRTFRWEYPKLMLDFTVGSGRNATVDSALKVAISSLEIGDQIKYDDTALGVKGSYSNDWYYVEGIRMNVPPNRRGMSFPASVLFSPSYVFRNLDALAFDLFDRADASGDLGTCTNSVVWANDSGFDIVSGAARANTNTLSMATLNIGAADQVVEVDLDAIDTGDEVGAVFRYTDANNQYRLYLDKGSNELILEKNVAGVVTEIVSPAYTVGTEHALRIFVQDTRIRVWADAVQLIDEVDSGLATGNSIGIFARNASGTTTFFDVYGQGL